MSDAQRQNGEHLSNPERRSLLRAATTLVAGATLLDTAQAQQSAGAPLSIPGFTPARIETSGGVTINAVSGGSGPPLLLLHGAPLTLYTWRDVAPGLAENFTVVASDLRGYGDSSKPQGAARPLELLEARDGAGSGRRDEALRLRALRRRRPGPRRPRHAPHGARPRRTRSRRRVLIDIVPTHYLYTHVNIEFVQAVLPLVQLPARRAGARERAARAARAQRTGQQSPAQAEYDRANGTPRACTACARTTAPARRSTSQHDAADLDTKVRCPLHVLWAENGAMDRLYDVLAIWRERARNVTGKAHARRPQHARRRTGRGAGRAQELSARVTAPGRWKRPCSKKCSVCAATALTTTTRRATPAARCGRAEPAIFVSATATVPSFGFAEADRANGRHRTVCARRCCRPRRRRATP